MPKFTFTLPDGSKRVVTTPEGYSAQQAWEFANRPPSAVGSPTHPGTQTQPEDFGSTGANLAAGAAQGVLNIPEGAAQLAEHIPYVGGAVRAVIPQGLRDWAKNYRQRAESTTAGEVGEFAGNVAPFLLQPEIGIASRAATVGRIPGFLGRVFERGTLPAAFEPVPPQPQPSGKLVAPDDFWTQKRNQALIGTGLGTLGETVASTLTRMGAGGAAQRAAQQQAERDYNAALAAHHTGTLGRAAEQATRAQAKTAKEAVPNETTLRWQKETLDRIGLGNQAPTRVTPEASARVQKLVGDRLNQIIGRMNLDRYDPSFTDTLEEIRHDTMGAIPESAQTGFYKPPAEQDLASPIINPVTGKPFPRATIGKPGKATGDWVRTVEEPLAKGNLSGRALSDYISRLGARAEELARDARVAPQDKRAELYAMSNAYRQVEDAVIGHAAGSAEDKTALEAARKAYSMWSIGNDAGRAAKGGVMTPTDLIRTISRRMSEARYKQALADPDHPDNALFSHLQQQLDRLREPLPPVRPASAVPRHPGRLTAPTAPPDSRLGQHAANALTHMALWHAPGVGHAAYWFGRPLAHAIARRAGPVVSRGAAALGRGVRRAEAPVSAGAANIVKQAQEPAMSFKWPDD